MKVNDLKQENNDDDDDVQAQQDEGQEQPTIRDLFGEDLDDLDAESGGEHETVRPALDSFVLNYHQVQGILVSHDAPFAFFSGHGAFGAAATGANRVH